MTVTAAASASTSAPSRPAQVRRIQRRSLVVLVLTQVIGGVGVATGIAVGALLAAAMGGTAVSGLSQSCLVIGAALLALPVTRLMRSRGRRPGLVLAYGIGVLGAALVAVAATRDSLPLLLLGLFCFGGGSAANYQARYAAVDLADPARRARQLSLVVWATTIGAVAGPNIAPVADTLGQRLGAGADAGPFLVSTAAFAVAALLVLLFLRPDPLLTARRLAAPGPALPAPGPALPAPGPAPPAPGPAPPAPGPALPATPAGPATAVAGLGVRAALREVAASPGARLGMAAVAVGHLVMIGVMSMTPVYIGSAGHGSGAAAHAETLRIVGIVLSLHIAGMYAFSPITGWLADRLGRRPVILTGIGLLLAACGLAGTAGHDAVRLSVGLALLGMGWSATMVAGSTLLTESVAVANRAAVQGVSDFVMGVAAATSGALSGVVVAWSSYATLTALAAVATVPLLALALRPVRLVGR